MTITSSPESVLPTVSRFETFSTTVTISASSESFDPVSNTIVISPGEVYSVNCVPNFLDVEIVIANGTSSFTVGGMHTTAFSADEVKYVEKGSSDILETPTVINNFADVPLNKDIFEANQDPSEKTIRTYTVYVNSSVGSANLTYTQTVENDVTAGYNFLRNYF